METKQKLILIASAAVCGLVIIGLAVFLFLKQQDVAQLKETVDQTKETISGYYEKTPYPSDANIEFYKSETEKFNLWSNEVLARIAKGKISIDKEETPIRFVTRITERVSELNKRQQSIRKEDSSVTAPDFGFGAYLVSGAELPSQENVARLAKQFAIIDTISTIFFDAGVVRITGITREMFDKSGTKPEPQQTGRGRRNANRNQQEKKTEATLTAIPENLSNLLTKESIKIECRARYSSIAKALNELTKNDVFMVVTDISVTQDDLVQNLVDDKIKKRESTLTSLQNKRGSRGRQQEPVAAPAVNVGIFDGVDPANRLISDPSSSAPLKVVISCDIYTAEGTEEAK